MSCLVAVYAAFERFVFGSRHDFLISDFSPFSQSRLSNQFLTFEDGGELNLVYDLGMGVARDSHRRCIYSCVCVSVCLHLIAS